MEWGDRHQAEKLHLEKADELLPGLIAHPLLANKSYDADERVIVPLQAQGKSAVINTP